MRKMLTVTESTSMYRLKMECAGVAAGSKILVGDWARAVAAKRDAQHTIQTRRADVRPLFVRFAAAGDVASRDKAR